MDMSMPMDPSVANLPITDPKCVQAVEACTAFYAAENASQAAIPWADLFEYGHWATYYWVIIVGLLFLYHIFTTIKDRRYLNTPELGRGPGLLRKVQAAGRMVFYRRLNPRGVVGWLDAPPNFGTLAFLLITIVFLIGLTFAARPYYREHLGYGSPPIAIRTGLMAYACVPILVALAGKANIVTLLTGISHERLNVLHRWVAWMSFALSLIHAIPYFIASLRDFGDGGFQRVTREFYARGWAGANEITGVPPLAILFGLCVFSLPQIRHQFYESFYAGHIVLAITYLGLLFWHAANTLDSWAYLWATLAIWLASWLARAFWKTQPLKISNTWFQGAPATLTVLPGNVTRVEVWPEGEFKWTPAQHAFLRFTDFAPLDNHPFTIASPPPAAQEGKRHLIFLARSHTGFTHKLASYVRNGSEKQESTVATTVWVDGPYGGATRPLHTRYDSLILVAGGTGISACLPWVLDSAAKANAKAKAVNTRLKRVVLVWAVRRADAVSWMANELESISARKEKGVEFTLRIHVTGSAVANTVHNTVEGKDGSKVTESAADNKIEKTGSETADSAYEDQIAALGSRVSGRPVMSQVLTEYVRPGERSVVFGCGPEGFRADLANAVAAAQKRVMSGECTEIGMHLETFGW